MVEKAGRALGPEGDAAASEKSKEASKESEKRVGLGGYSAKEFEDGHAVIR